MEEAKRRGQELGLTEADLLAIPLSRLPPETEEQKREIQAIREEQQEIDQKARDEVKEIEGEIKDLKASKDYQKYLKLIEEGEFRNINDQGLVTKQEKYLADLEERKTKTNERCKVQLEKKEQDLEKVKLINKAHRLLEYLDEKLKQQKADQKLEKEKKAKEKEEQKRKEAEEAQKAKEAEKVQEEEEEFRSPSASEGEETILGATAIVDIEREEEEEGDPLDDDLFTPVKDRKTLLKADREALERLRGSRLYRKRVKDIKQAEIELDKRREAQLQEEQAFQEEKLAHKARETHAQQYWEQKQVDYITKEKALRRDFEVERENLFQEYHQNYQKLQTDTQKVEQDKLIIQETVQEYKQKKAQLNQEEKELKNQKKTLEEEYTAKKQDLEKEALQYKQLNQQLENKIEQHNSLIAEQNQLVQEEKENSLQLQQEIQERQKKFKEEDLERQQDFEKHQNILKLEEQILDQRKETLENYHQSLQLKEDQLAATEIKQNQVKDSDSEYSVDLYTDINQEAIPYKSQFRKLGKLIKTEFRTYKNQSSETQKQIDQRNLKDNIVDIKTKILERTISYNNIIHSADTPKRKNTQLHIVELGIEQLTSDLVNLLQRYQAVIEGPGDIELPPPLAEYRVSETGERISIDDYFAEQLNSTNPDLYYRNPEYPIKPPKQPFETITPVDPEVEAEIAAKGRFKRTPVVPKPPSRYTRHTKPKSHTSSVPPVEEILPVGQSTLLPSTSYPDPDPSDSSGGSDSDN